MLTRMLCQVEHLLDQLQFAYRSRRSVEDATLSMLNNIIEHLESPGSYARIPFIDISRIPFIDISSAFNANKARLFVLVLVINMSCLFTFSLPTGNSM